MIRKASSIFYPKTWKIKNPGSLFLLVFAATRLGCRFLVRHAFADAALERARVDAVFLGDVGQTQLFAVDLVQSRALARSLGNRREPERLLDRAAAIATVSESMNLDAERAAGFPDAAVRFAARLDLPARRRLRFRLRGHVIFSEFGRNQLGSAQSAMVTAVNERFLQTVSPRDRRQIFIFHAVDRVRTQTCDKCSALRIL